MMTSLVLIELQAASKIQSDVGRHLEVVYSGEILKRDLIRLLDQESFIIAGSDSLPMSGLVGEQCVQGDLPTFVFGD